MIFMNEILVLVLGMGMYYLKYVIYKIGIGIRFFRGVYNIVL